MTMRLRQHLTYANVCASLALFVALSGSGYAAATLARDSVGSRELKRDSVGASEVRANAITSASVRDGSLAARDFAPSAKSALTGPAGAPGTAGQAGSPGIQGERGPQGDPGAPGAAAVTLRAVVGFDGAIFDSSEGADADLAGTGNYLVTFPRSAAGCVYSATLARVNGTDPDARTITVASEGNAVRVRTFDGVTPDGSGFHLIVVCS
jgi:hypothetical protein